MLTLVFHLAICDTGDHATCQNTCAVLFRRLETEGLSIIFCACFYDDKEPYCYDSLHMHLYMTGFTEHHHLTPARYEVCLETVYAEMMLFCVLMNSAIKNKQNVVLCFTLSLEHFLI